MEKMEHYQHPIALHSEGPWVGSIGTATATSEDLCGGRYDQCKRAKVCGAAIMRAMYNRKDEDGS
jgi:hypothetical protein